VTSKSPGVAILSRLLRTRWLVRIPIRLYRRRLGFLFGSRLLMLEHIGRKSGAKRYVVLEVVDHPQPRTYVVVSGFGPRAQWFRNIQADPHVRVFVGGRKPVTATARVLGPEQSGAVLASYARRHPRAWKALRPVFETTLGAAIDENSTQLPLVALDLA
jgi:deazaflavin-dependent oxidoreductase (nitroreductase family)